MTTWLPLISAALGKTTPLLLASMGGMLSELSGVINFALEGMMLVGAFAAVWTTFVTGSPWLGLAGGAIGGMMVGLMHGLISLVLRVNQIVSSIALNLLASGLTGVLLNHVFKVYGTSPSVPSLPTLDRLIASVFSVERLFFPSFGAGLSVMAPFALCIGLFSVWFFRHTVWGLRIRACGESPQAAKAAGIPVFGLRLAALLAGGALAGLGGAYLSIGEISQFVENMTHGRGYVAIAALILGRWRPAGVLLATLFFGVSETFSEWMAIRWSQAPHQAFLVFPYLIGFLVLMLHQGKRQAPSGLGRL